MADILQITFSNTFCWLKTVIDCCAFIQRSLKFGPRSVIDSESAFVEAINKYLLKPTMTRFTYAHMRHSATMIHTLYYGFSCGCINRCWRNNKHINVWCASLTFENLCDVSSASEETLKYMGTSSGIPFTDKINSTSIISWMHNHKPLLDLSMDKQ